MSIFSSFLTGLVFGLGLILSGMANPGKVVSFLDLAGNWDPSLAFVMGGAVTVAFFAFRAAGRRSRSLLGSPIQVVRSREIDARLILGSATFGIGWGVAGYCPGPALVSLGTGHPKALIFLAAMLAGMLLYNSLNRKTLERLGATP